MHNFVEIQKCDVKVNGVPISDVKSLDYHADGCFLPTITIDFTPELKVESDAEVVFTPESVRTACVVLRNELLKCDDLYYGFLASVESALVDSGTCTSVHDVAVSVIDRIIGEWLVHDDNNGD